MKERPILMSAPMIRALLAGKKTQTRRIIRPQPEIVDRINVRWTKYGQMGPDHYLRDIAARFWCPYGQAGDRFWVRETWAGDELCGTVYRADHPNADIKAGDLDDGDQQLRRWCPSIYMPRWASRITLEIIKVRVEQLQAIGTADIKAEGVPIALEGTTCAEFGYERRLYRELWDSINGKGAWDVNPWVWVIEFVALAMMETLKV